MCDTESELFQQIKYVSGKSGSQEKGQELKPENAYKKPETLFLYLAVLTGNMIICTTGATMVWTSPVIPKLISNNSEESPIGRQATTLEISMIAGFPLLTTLLGALIVGNLAELFGRKRILQTMGVGLLFSTVLLAFSTNVIFIIISRCLIFFFGNAAMTVYPIYLIEICEDHNRAKYGCLMGLFLPLGCLFGFALGSFLSTRLFTLMSATPLILFIYFFFFAPESPVYSLSKGRKEECVQALKKLRSNKNKQELEADLNKIVESIKVQAGQTKSNMLSILGTKEKRYAMLLAMGPPLMQCLSGGGVLLQFLAPLFIEAGTKFNSNYLATIVGVIKVCSFFFTSLIVERTGRRPMLLISSIGSGIPLLFLGYFFYLKRINSSLIPYLQWLPLSSVILFIIMYSLGLGPIPIAIMGELFTPDMRASGVSFIMTILGIFMFALTSIYPFISESLGTQWCMWMYSLFCFVGATFIYTMIPETKGKSLVEIQEYIKKRCNT